MNSHCGPGGFSPPAPPELCSNTVPEPGTWVLILIGFVILVLIAYFNRPKE